ncbi:MAG TPA: permease-like cell division protein FtsX [Oligoflexia bacterium]|nr:permease-like cell division protein FtsX [Oligoflexia bacterium]HMP48856.1 permease-like cell division protein FtsX [Oligoflexia bacterium]
MSTAGKSSSIQGQIKDVRVEFGVSFLSEYWDDTELLPIESRYRAIFSTFSRAFAALRAAPLTTLSSYIIVSASLMVLTLFILFDFNIQRLLDQVGSSHEGVVYFKNFASKEDINIVQQQLLETKLFSNIRYVDKSEAIALFKDDLGGKSELLKGLEENPLPNALEFEISGDLDSVEVFSSISEKIGQFEFVDDMSLGAPWADAAQRLRVGVAKMSLTILVIVLCVVMFIVSNVVKLMLFSQKEEIEIMQLVGAPRLRIALPYLINGFMQGFLGAVTSILICYFLFTAFMRPLNTYLVLGVSYDAFAFPGAFYILLILCVGILLGIGGSLLALRRWIE